jgi:hypothetical protein
MRRIREFRLFAALVLAVLSLASTLPVLAQSTATVRGTVTDPSGAVVPNAKVIVKNQATGVEQSTVSDSAGIYQVAGLLVGVYRIEVQAQGFQPQAVNNLRLEVSQTVAQNFQLKVGGVTEEVTVVSEGPVVENTTITVGQVINQKTVAEIPLNGRHFVDLGLLIPGSVTPPQNGFLTAPLRGQGSFAFNTAGNREDTVNFMINGINLNDMVQNQITFQPTINTISEFKVNNSTYSAEYGRNSGAVVNIATRSGTNEFHGEAFEYIRNSALDARNFFEGTRDPAPFKRNQFGASGGGPIFKDRTFFYSSYEGLRHRQGLTINGGVLTDAQRAAVTDPVSRRLLDFIPRPNAFVAGAARFQGAATAPVNIDQFTQDINHVLGANDRVHGYYAIQRDRRGEPTLQGNTIPNWGDTRRARRQIFTLNEVHTFGPSIVNEARFGFNRIHITFDPNVKLNPAEFGIRNGINEAIALPQITITQIGLNFGGPNGFPQGRGDTTFVFSDTVNYLRGNHSVKFGGEFRRFFNNNFAKTPGTFAFATVDDFLRGNANNFTITLGNVASSIAQGALGLFVQDNLKWKPNLSLELGLRYDWLMSPTERFDRFVTFDPAIASLVRVGSGRDQLYKTNHNLHPRIGLVWDPFNDGKTSVRAAYAILADQPVTNLITGTAANPPLATPLTFAGAIRWDNAATTARAAGVAPTAINADFSNAYVQSWNVNVQREITPTLGVSVGYYGSKGTHLRIQRNVNQLRNNVRVYPTLSASSPILPGAAIGNIFFQDSAGNSSYNALWVTANKRFAKGLQFNASYTWSKSIDYNSLNSQGTVIQDSFNVRGDRGLSDFDARNRFVINWIYELPFHGNRLVEGWQVSGITQLQDGNPVNIITNLTFTGVANTVRPDVTGPISVPGSLNQWFSNSVCDPRTSCAPGTVFALPAAAGNVFHFGNLGRNVVIGPGFSNTDFSVIKNTRVTENTQVQFRAEMFDIFNHANFGQPGRIALVGSTAFGRITNTRFPTGDSGSSRQIQFALKFVF